MATASFILLEIEKTKERRVTWTSHQFSCSCSTVRAFVCMCQLSPAIGDDRRSCQLVLERWLFTGMRSIDGGHTVGPLVHSGA
jgi:hypothetical protein